LKGIEVDFTPGILYFAAIVSISTSDPSGSLTTA
jgi:hypothetical protein